MSDKQYWYCAPGENASQWDQWVSGGYISIGWDELGDLKNYPSQKAIQDKLDAQEAPGQHIDNGKKAKTNWDFCSTIKIGDIILAKTGFKKLLGWGVVTSDYYYDDTEEDYKSKRNIEWRSTDVKSNVDTCLGKRLPQKTLTIIEDQNVINKIKDMYQFPEISIEGKYMPLLMANHNIILTGAPGTGKTYLAKKIAEAMNAETEFVQFHPSYDYTDFVEGLRPVSSESGEIGFRLMSGSFKSFCMRALQNSIDSTKPIEQISAEQLLENAYNDLVDKIRNGEVDKLPLKTEGKQMDIVEISDNGNIVLKTEGTVATKEYIVSLNRLKKLAAVYKDLKSLEDISNIYESVTAAIKGCHTSSYWAALHYLYKNMPPSTPAPAQVEKKNFVFIIDEINRGEISKIFGELFFSIDPGYRGEKGKVKTQYANLQSEDDGTVFDSSLGQGWFYVPENVYIIGTMNDIDRSVESMDFAMRRRFTWIEVKAEDRIAMWDDSDDGIAEWKAEALKRMSALNDAIEKVEGLSSAYDIGPAYFLKLKQCKGDFNQLWEYHLEGLLKEYLRGMPDADKKLGALHNAYNQKEDGKQSVPAQPKQPVEAEVK